MRTIFFYFLRLAFAFLLLFWISRLVFLIYFLDRIGGFSSEFFLSFYYGFPLDLSAVGYLLIFPFLVLSIYIFIRQSFFIKITTGYFFLMAIIIGFITAGNLGIYEEWNAQIGYKAVSYLRHFDEAVKSSSSKYIFAFFVVSALIISLAYLISKKLLTLNPHKQKKLQWLPISSFILLTPGILLLLIRGGFSEVPIMQSRCYFSKNQTINEASVNTFWNFGFDILKTIKYSDINRYHFFNDKTAKDIIKKLYTFPQDSVTPILTTTHPNIVFIVLESWPADLVESLGGLKKITPNVDSLIHHGLSFRQMIATGHHSEEGVVALFSGFPSLATAYIMNMTDKVSRLPSIFNILHDNGYHTSFHFGGELSYGNIKSYFYSHTTDIVVEQRDFDDSIPSGKLGIHDQYLFDRLLHDIDHYPQPFLAGAFTASTHSPYDVPFHTKQFNQYGSYTPYIVSAHYADSCIGDFLRRAKQKSWYKNTLFVFSSDHIHLTPVSTPFCTPEGHRITAFFYGDVLKNKFQGKQITDIVSQIDIPKILLDQLHLPSKKFVWSKDYFNPKAPHFAFYSYKHCAGFAIDSCFVGYHLYDNKLINSSCKKTQTTHNLITIDKAYLQEAYSTYLTINQ